MRLQKEFASFIFLGGGDSEIAQEENSLFLEYSMYLFLNLSQKSGLRQQKRLINIGYFLRLIHKGDMESTELALGPPPLFFSIFFKNKNFKVEVILVIVLVCWCPQTQLVLKKFFFCLSFWKSIQCPFILKSN